jgi:acyl-CoA hydrolase
LHPKTTETAPFGYLLEVVQEGFDQIPLGQMPVSMTMNGVTFASSRSFTVTPPALRRLYDSLKFFRSRVLLRPQEISNSPEIIRRLGIISVNTAIEVDIFGNVNSTHVMGRKLMNGIGNCCAAT